MTTVAEFVVCAEPGAWNSVGFDVDADGVVQLGGIRIRLVGAGAGSGMTEWVLADAPDPAVALIDGLRTSHGEPAVAAGREHPNGVVSIDHVVINTPDLERTCDAIAAATDAPLKRVREAGPIRQGFHRLGEVIVEVVTFAGIDAGDAQFWGLALNARDLDALAARVGPDLMSAPKTAVQPGRRIASFRREAGLGLPVAVMDHAAATESK